MVSSSLTNKTLLNRRGLFFKININLQANTIRGASDVKKFPLYDRINQFPGQHISVKTQHDISVSYKQV